MCACVIQPLTQPIARALAVFIAHHTGNKRQKLPPRSDVRQRCHGRQLVSEEIVAAVAHAYRCLAGASIILVGTLFAFSSNNFFSSFLHGVGFYAFVMLTLHLRLV